MTLEELERVVGDLSPETLLLEADPRRKRSVLPGRSRVVDWAHDHGLRVVYMSVAEACESVACRESTVALGERLASRYDELATRVSDRDGRLKKDPDRWRNVRPLVVAFGLAHAFASGAVTAAFSGPPTSPRTRNSI